VANSNFEVTPTGTGIVAGPGPPPGPCPTVAYFGVARTTANSRFGSVIMHA